VTEFPTTSISEREDGAGQALANEPHPSQRPALSGAMVSAWLTLGYSASVDHSLLPMSD
jgi:hypothetical protein